MQRLRMGRIFDRAGSADDLADVQAFEGIVPYRDMESGDDEVAGRFCEVLELLYRRLAELASLKTTCSGWRDAVAKLARDFLAIPEEHQGEEAVRDGILAGLASLAGMDDLRHARGLGDDVDLAFARQFLESNMGQLARTIGQYLTGGVTISELQPMRPIPFRIIYIMGLGEGNFPGQASRSGLDLRTLALDARDVGRPETNRYLFLETLLSAKSRLYLSYVCRDLQRDQELYPGSVLNQLLRYLGEYKVLRVPLSGSNVRYLESGSGVPPLNPPASEGTGGTGGTDALVNYSRHDRLICLLDGGNQQILSEAQRQHVAQAEKQFRPDFSASAAQASAAPAAANIQVRHLRKFLENPIEASLQRHLGLWDDQEPSPEDDEPFYSVFPRDWRCRIAMLTQFVLRRWSMAARPR